MTLTTMIQEVLSGTGATLTIFFSTLVISLPLGLIVAFGRMSDLRPFKRLEGDTGAVNLLRKFNPLRLIVQFLISILRGTPLMLQLIVWCYGPYYLFGIRLTPQWRIAATILGFGINYAAYFAEIFRAGIQGIPSGQREAAKVLGYTRSQTFIKIVFPQMIKAVLPPVTNEIITLVKDTSLAFVLVYVEVFTLAKQVAAAQTTIMPLFIAGAFYYVFNLVVAGIMGKVERSLNYYQ